MLASEISWERFAAIHDNPNDAFESLSWQLFKSLYVDKNEIIHANSNNPGVESDPVLSKDGKTRVGFQAKWLKDMDYPQIKKSAKKTIKYYSGEIDRVYVFCNQDINVKSKGYIEIRNLLHEKNIEIIPISNQTILHMVLESPDLAEQYFGVFIPKKEWFKDKLSENIHMLDQRFNPFFNVSNETQLLLSLFSRMDNSVNYLNEKKRLAITRIDEMTKYLDWNVDSVFQDIKNTIDQIEDISSETVLQVLEWEKYLEDTLKKHEEDTNNRILSLREDAQAIEEESLLSEHNEKWKLNNIYRKIDCYENLQNISTLLQISQEEKQSLTTKVVYLSGDRGTGKSHSMALLASKLMEKGNPVLLFLGQKFISENEVTLQMVSDLGISVDFNTLITVLDSYGDRLGKDVFIFIDALNESSYKKNWKQGLYTIINKVKKSRHLKLLFSCRSGYEKSIISDEVNTEIINGDILYIAHTGFSENSLEAVKKFMEYYGVPFAPTTIFNSEISNPLFLTLLCKNYKSPHATITDLYRSIIEQAEKETRSKIEIETDIDLVSILIDEFVSKLIESLNRSQLILEVFLNLGFWSTYGLESKKLPYYHVLKDSGLFSDYPIDGKEYVGFGFDLFRDLACAKQIVQKHPVETNLRKVLKETILGNTEGNPVVFNNIELFVACCSEYADKYHKECIDLIDDINGYEEALEDKKYILCRYYRSFDWRNPNSYTWQTFINVVKTYGISSEDFCHLFIRHSVECQHPLNAFQLHSYLIQQSLAERDAGWTIFINQLNFDDRIMQIIDYIERGYEFDFDSLLQYKLLALLFTWMLSSSNRIVRDKTSKALVVILSKNCSLCKYLLDQFEGCNDPYIMQRLYGVILGATLSQEIVDEEEFSLLVNTVYSNVFNQEDVYPDILLRDYARTIIERWLYKYPHRQNEIDYNRCISPYPVVEVSSVDEIEEVDFETSPGLHSIQMSMTPNVANVGIGMYGDFGRYVFQSRISYFKGADIKYWYNYALDFIVNQLGYNEETHGYYDTHLKRSYGRYENKKVERIGKKYEWISYFHVLARISDKYPVESDKLTGRSELYMGAWHPMIRDFDPTLNIHLHRAPNDPVIQNISDCRDFLTEEETSRDIIYKWAESDSECIQNYPERLRVKDNNNISWILLTNQFTSTNKTFQNQYMMEYSFGGQRLKIDSYACIAKWQDYEAVIKIFSQMNLWKVDIVDFPQEYLLFNKEYSWSTAYKDIYSEHWYDLKYSVDSEEGCENDELNVRYSPLTSGYIWEGEYDASIDEAVSMIMPSQILVDTLELDQKGYNGHFYDKDGNLVIINGFFSECGNGLLIREDVLKSFLVDNDYVLFWPTTGSKLFTINQKRWGNIQSEWSGVYWYRDGEISGTIKCFGVFPRDVE